MCDEAESLIPKLGYDVLKSVISNGAIDADVKYSSDTNRPDGCGLLVVGVGNSLYDQMTGPVDKAFVERIAHFKFDRLVDDKHRDPDLQNKLGEERGVQHIYNALLYLDALRSKTKSAKFWSAVASPNLRTNRELAKLEGDYCAQLLSGYSSFYRVTPDSEAAPFFLEELHTAVCNYYIERKQNPAKMPRNWMDAVKRLPYYSVKKVRVCGVCEVLNPTKRTCGRHYNTANIASRDMVFGMVLTHFPLGQAASVAASAAAAAMDALDPMEDDGAPPGVQDPDAVDPNEEEHDDEQKDQPPPPGHLNLPG
jgi:hypothetical protein